MNWGEIPVKPCYLLSCCRKASFYSSISPAAYPVLCGNYKLSGCQRICTSISIYIKCQRELSARTCIMCMYHCTLERRYGSSPCVREKSHLCTPCCKAVRNYQHNRYCNSIATSRTRIKLFTGYQP